MNLIERLIDKLKQHPTDGNDARVLQAARQVVSRGMGSPMVIGDRSLIKTMAARLDIQTKGIRIIEPSRAADLETFAGDLKQLPRFSELTDEQAAQRVLEPNVFAALMTRRNQAEALLSGARERTSHSLRPLFQIIGRQQDVSSASALLILELEAKQVGIEGALFMGDCGVIPEPNAQQLADIAVTTAQLTHHLTGAIPKVAMLSYTTHGNPERPQVERILEATRLAKNKAASIDLEMEIEGDLQVDAALDQATAIIKGIQSSPVAGAANVLIFPDLNSGNIASKLVQILTGANKFGQIIMGLNCPVVEISRGSSAHDILGAAAIAGCQAIDRGLIREE